MIENPGALTAKAKAAGVSLSAFEHMRHADPGMRKQVWFAPNAKKWRQGGKEKGGRSLTFDREPALGFTRRTVAVLWP